MEIKDFLTWLKWILLTGGPLFFFIRAIGLATTGGDCFGTINPTFSWLLLVLEIVISGTAGGAGIIRLMQWNKKRSQNLPIVERGKQKIIIFAGTAAYLIHFIRVAIWIILCVI